MNTSNSVSIKRRGPGTMLFLTLVTLCLSAFVIAVLFTQSSCTRSTYITVKPQKRSNNTSPDALSGSAKPSFQKRSLQKFDQRDLGRITERANDAPWVMPWDYYEPQYECTLGEDLVGRDAFGAGVWTCGVQSLLQASNCVVYIIGTSDKTAFEADILQYTQCQVHVFSVKRIKHIEEGTEEKIDRVYVHGLFIGDKTDEDNGVLSLDDAMDSLGHDHIDFVYVAPHGDSMLVAATVIDSKKWIGQVSLGFHYDPDTMRGPTPRRKLSLIKDFDTMHNSMMNSQFVLILRQENSFIPRSVQMLYGNLKPRPAIKQ